MSYKKKTLVLNLNEINLTFILKNAKKYKSENILKFFKNKNLIKTITKESIIKIKSTLKDNSCVKSNNILTQYEIWIVKNIFPELCKSRYHFEKKINILF